MGSTESRFAFENADMIMGKKLSRRRFINQASLFGMGATSMIGLSTISKSKSIENMMTRSYQPSSQTKKLQKLLGIDIPIIQAPTGGNVPPELVASVSNATALGGLPLTWADNESAKALLKTVFNQTERNFYVNYVLNFPPKSLELVINRKVPIIQFSWGMPSQDMVRKIKDAGIILGIQVGGRNDTKTALNLSADYLVCQGVEAGGHVQGTYSLETALKMALNEAKDTPVVASGGIAGGKSMATYMNQGAAGVIMGSRFVASEENSAHNEYKKLLIEAKKEDTVFTVLMNKGWENSAHRILRNSTFNNWEASGCPLVGERPGEHDVIAINGGKRDVIRYSISSPLKISEGNVEAMALYAGSGIDDITQILPASEIVKNVWEEFLINQ